MYKNDFNKCIKEVREQLASNNPNLIKDTFEILKNKGISEEISKILLALYLAKELIIKETIEIKNCEKFIEDILNVINFETIEEDIYKIIKIYNSLDKVYQENNEEIIKNLDEVYRDLLIILNNQKIKSIEEFNYLYLDGTHYLHWLNYYINTLTEIDEYQDYLIKVIDNVEKYIDDEFELLNLYKVKSQTLFKTGRENEAIEFLNKKLKQYYNWGDGYIALSEIYEKNDINKSVNILISACKNKNINNLRDISDKLEIMMIEKQNLLQNRKKEIKRTINTIDNKEELSKDNMKYIL